MENTCDYENCKFAKNLFDSPEECFNYIQSWWTPSDGGQPVLIKDCIPKRQFLMIQDLHNRLAGVQKSQEEQRNESNRMKESMINFTNVVSENSNLIRIEENIDENLLGEVI